LFFLPFFFVQGFVVFFLLFFFFFFFYCVSSARVQAGLQSAVAGRLRSAHHSLSHATLAQLPVSEVVTTNYDEVVRDPYC
jgi:hypothetical protein